ncbi:hypothetical protein HDU98_006149, partial [Podochytrium sp. JEL0797]
MHASTNNKPSVFLRAAFALDELVSAKTSWPNSSGYDSHHPSLSSLRMALLALSSHALPSSQSIPAMMFLLDAVRKTRDPRGLDDSVAFVRALECVENPTWEKCGDVVRRAIAAEIEE